MWQKLNLQQKKLVSLAAMVVLFYLAYIFSFKHTLAAISLNRQLTNEQNNAQGTTESFSQIDRKNKFYLQALKSYQVKKEDRENKLWQAVSGMAMANEVAISFNPNAIPVADSTAITNAMVQQQFSFKGNYFKLVKLVDSLSKTKSIGQLAELRLFTNKDSQTQTKQLNLQVKLVAVER